MSEALEPPPALQHLMGAALDFLRSEGWPLPRRIDQEIVELDYERDDVPWVCYLEAREGERQILFYSTLKLQAPPDRIAALLEFAARANAGLAIGNFELDPDDGEIRFKTSIDVNNSELTPGLLSGLTSLNVAAMNVYLPAIQAVIAGADPRTAIAAVEGS